MEMLTSKEMIELIEATGLKARSYSGRGMYGKICVGVSTDEGILATVADLILAIDDKETIHYFADCLSGANSDIVRGREILYFPNIEWIDTP